MKCKWDKCDNEARAKSPFCSGTCKKRFQRASGTKPELSGTPVPVEVEVGQTAPSTQSTDEQEAGESTKSETPEQLDAMKAVVQIEPDILDHIDMNKVIDVVSDAEQPDISLLPPGVSKPTGRRTGWTSVMLAQDLRTRTRYYKGTAWTASPEYAETIHRLLTLTIEQLDAEGQFVPAWRLRQEPPQATSVDESKVKVEC